MDNVKGKELPAIFEQYHEQICAMAWKGAARAKAIDAPYGFEDLVQELNITLMKCVRGYRSGTEATFHTYLYQALWRRVETILKPYQRERNAGAKVSLDQRMPTDEDNGSTMMDRVANLNAPSPEEVVICDDMTDAVRSLLSGDALAMFNMILEPPLEVIEQYHAKTFGAYYDRQHGGASRSYPDVGIRFLSALFQLNRAQVARIKREIRTAFDRAEALYV